MNSICVLFNRLGPYHTARLNAVGALLPTLGLELFGQDREYGWNQTEHSGGFQKISAFPKSDGAPRKIGDPIRRVFALLDEYQPGSVAIPGWSSKGALAALSWCVKVGRPAIVMSDSQSSDAIRTWPKEAAKKGIVRMCAAGLVAGTPHVEYLADLGMARERIFTGYDVVDNNHSHRGADAARGDANRLRARWHLPEKYFLACSRFIAKKNLRRLVEAYHGYRQLAGAAAWDLVLIGDGPLRPRLETQVQQLGLGGHVSMPGFKQYDELPIYYGLAGAFVHAGITEQWGLVVNEAMASGLPVLVSARCGCARDLIAAGKNGFVFDPFDTMALSQLLRRISSADCDLAAMGRASRDLIGRWSPQTFATNLKRASDSALEVPRRKVSIVNQAILRLLQRTAA
jgi:1,2-diacylglycerol 3-alpha-glucosyltransferase